MEIEEYDTATGEVVVINESGLPDSDVIPAIREQIRAPEIAAISRWVSSNSGGSYRQRKQGTLFDRDRFATPELIFDKFRTAADAARVDDVVAGVCETTEQLAFKRLAVECDDLQQEDIWNQIVEEMDIAQRMREIWRELFTISQCYPAILWQNKTYTVRGKTPNGTKSKKKFTIKVPRGITLLDPCKVIPVGSFMFGDEKLIYLAGPGEAKNLDESLANKNSSDLVVKTLFKGRYDLSPSEKELIQEITGESVLMGVNAFELDPDNVWRITATRPDYQRFADVRMESVFELLDLKNQLRQMDRASLIGSTNAIILVKRGSDDHPAKQADLQRLATQVGGTARQPILVTDHTVEVEIITPKTDKTLAAERYNALDSRITSRLYQILASGSYSSGTAADNSIKLFQVISASMEARRDTIRDSIVKHILKQIFDKNDVFTEEPKLQFYPRRIALAFDPNIATFMMDLRDARDLSRDTMLAELDILEADEAVKVQRENEFYNEIFQAEQIEAEQRSLDEQKMGEGSPDNAPSGPAPTSQRVAGRRGGGRKNGGGMNRESQRTNPPRGDDKTPRKA